MSSSVVNAEAAQWFCEQHDCPDSWKDANEENCCIHHANIHSCPLGYMARHFLLAFAFMMLLIIKLVMSESLVWVVRTV